MAMGKRRLWRDYYAGPCLCQLHLTGHKNLSLKSFVKVILFIKFVVICLMLVLLYYSLVLLPGCECSGWFTCSNVFGNALDANSPSRMRSMGPWEKIRMCKIISGFWGRGAPWSQKIAENLGHNQGGNERRNVYEPFHEVLKHAEILSTNK